MGNTYAGMIISWLGLFMMLGGREGRAIGNRLVLIVLVVEPVPGDD